MMFALFAPAIASQFYLKTGEEELCLAHALWQDDEVVLDLKQRDPFTPGVYLYIFVRHTLRRSKSPVESFILRDQQNGRFIYQHKAKKEAFFCFSSYGDIFLSVSIDRNLSAPQGLITAGDLQSLEKGLYGAVNTLAEFGTAHEEFLSKEEGVVEQNAAADRHLGLLSLAEAALLVAVCAAQYFTLTRMVAAPGRIKL